MKDTSIRISGYADKIFEAYLFHKNEGLSGRQKLTKRSLMEAYASKLMTHIPDTIGKT